MKKGDKVTYMYEGYLYPGTMFYPKYTKTKSAIRIESGNEPPAFQGYTYILIENEDIYLDGIQKIKRLPYEQGII